MSKYKSYSTLDKSAMVFSWESLQEALDDIDKRLNALEERLDNVKSVPIGQGDSLEQHLANLKCDTEMGAGAWRTVVDCGAELEKCIKAIEDEHTDSAPIGTEYEVITPITECSIDQLIDCGPECAVYTDVAKADEIKRRIAEAAKPTKRQQVAEAFLRAALSDEDGVEDTYSKVVKYFRKHPETFLTYRVLAKDGMLPVLEAAAKEEDNESH